jgi:hypothetical protein
MAQDEYEQQSRVGFSLERLVKSVDGLVGMTAWQSRRESAGDALGTPGETILEETDEFRTTRIDVEDGPEIIKIVRK